MNPHKLSDELSVKRNHLGSMVYVPICEAEQPGVSAPGGTLVLTDHEMIELVGWWCERHNSPLNGDMIDMIMDRVRCKELHPKTAAVCVRAIMAREVAQAVGGWVMDDEIPALGDKVPALGDDEGGLR